MNLINNWPTFLSIFPKCQTTIVSDPSQKTDDLAFCVFSELKNAVSSLHPAEIAILGLCFVGLPVTHLLCKRLEKREEQRLEEEEFENNGPARKDCLKRLIDSINSYYTKKMEQPQEEQRLQEEESTYVYRVEPLEETRQELIEKLTELIRLYGLQKDMDNSVFLDPTEEQRAQIMKEFYERENAINLLETLDEKEIRRKIRVLQEAYLLRRQLYAMRGFN